MNLMEIWERRGRWALMALLVVLSLWAMKSSASAETKAPVIRVGCFPLNGFYDFDEQTGEITGYGAEYTEEVFRHMNREFEYVKYASWVEALDALSKNEIDLLAPAQHTAERDAMYEFDSFPISTEYGALLSLSTNDKLIYEDYQAYQGLSVGVVPSLIFLDQFKSYEKRNDFSVHFTYYKDTAALVAALNSGEVDAILANMMVKTESMKLLARFGASPVYYMMSPGAKGILEDVNHAIDSLSSEHPELQNELSNVYFADFNKLPFSKEELNYIAHCGTLKIACRSEYAPFSYVDQKTGKMDGVDQAVLDRISQISGLSFSYVALPKQEDNQQFMQAEDIAIISGVEHDVETTLHDTSYSESYLRLSKYFVGFREDSIDTSKKHTVAVVRTSTEQIEMLKQTFPNFQFQEYPSVEQCIAALHNGKSDYVLGDRYSMERILASPRNEDLKLFPSEVIPSKLCFQVLSTADKEQVLTSILNKSIRMISEEEKNQLLDEYSQKNRYQYQAADFLYQYRYQIIIVSVFVLMGCVVLLLLYYTRRKVRLEIQENEMKLRNITNNINGGVIVLLEEEGLRITFANDGFLELIGCTREEFDHEGNGSYLAYVHPDDLHVLREAIASPKSELSLELRVLKKDGTYVPALFNCTSEIKSDGVVEHYCVILDMTEQNKMMEQLRVDKRRTDLILERVDEIFYEIDLRDRSISTSLSFFQKMGWSLPKRIPDDKKEYGNMWHVDQENLQKLRCSTEELQRKKEPVSTIVLMKSVMEKRFVWCEVFQHPILSEEGKLITIIGLIRDVDEQVSERETLLAQAQRDPLTGLYNKETFEDIVTDTLEKMSTQNHALIFIDLDHFKNVNDTLGHLAGDQAICDAADKLKIIFSNFDVLSRFGGDEFCIFVKNIPWNTLQGKMNWLLDKMRQEYGGDQGTVAITCSCGIACTDTVGYDYETMMKCADEALYASKEQGRDRYTFYGKRE